MNYITLILGILAALYGLYSLYARFYNPDILGKLEAMKQRFGEGVGGTLHLIHYTIIPITIGVYLIYLGINGVSLF